MWQDDSNIIKIHKSQGRNGLARGIIEDVEIAGEGSKLGQDDRRCGRSFRDDGRLLFQVFCGWGRHVGTERGAVGHTIMRRSRKRGIKRAGP